MVCASAIFANPSALTLCPLAAARAKAYLWDVLRDYEHKRAHNKRIGPGGGTRRLHQTTLIWGRRGTK